MLFTRILAFSKFTHQKWERPGLRLLAQNEPIRGVGSYSEPPVDNQRRNEVHFSNVCTEPIEYLAVPFRDLVVFCSVVFAVRFYVEDGASIEAV